MTKQSRGHLSEGKILIAPLESDRYDELYEKISQGKVVLFLGAGASCAAGAPNSNNLVKNIKLHFPKIDQELSNLTEVCQDVIDTPPYTRKDLVEFVRDQFLLLNPSDTHLLITKFNWAGIITTNYDDLIEQAYRKSEKAYSFRLFYEAKLPKYITDRKRINIFKMMGTILTDELSSGKMILTTDDFNNAIRRREDYIEVLYDIVKDGTILFIGYSFNDRIALNIMNQVINKHGFENVPYTYAVFHDIADDEKTRHIINSRKIIPIKTTFEDFFTFLNKKLHPKIEKKTSDRYTLKLKDQNIELDTNDVSIILDDFQLLTEQATSEPEGNQDEFFKGVNQSWGAYKINWDFKRDIYINPDYVQIIRGTRRKGSLKNRIIHELQTFDEDNKIIYLTGMPGSGKTFLLKRIAFDAYRSGLSPVLILNSDRMKVDAKGLASFIRIINRKYDSLTSYKKGSPPLKPLIIFDNAAILLRELNFIRKYLASRGRQALILAVDRENEFYFMSENYNLPLSNENIYRIDENLNDGEKVRIIDHLFNLGYIENKGIHWDDIIQREYKESFFATIYTLLDPAKRPLNQIIKDQYIKLEEDARRAFRYICIFHQYGYSIPLELLVRTLNCGYDHFLNKIIGVNTLGLIYEDNDRYGNILYRSHHRIIAQKTAEFFFGDPEELKQVLSEILMNVRLTYRTERQLIEKILIFRIGPNIKRSPLTLSQLRELYTIACSRNATRSLLHHWGILEMEDNQYDTAEDLLKKALSFEGLFLESYKGESVQNVLTSLGSLYTKMGFNYQSQGNDVLANENYTKAELQFRRAKIGEYQNIYAYHAHAHMNFQRAKNIKNNEDKIKYISEALKIISDSKDNINISHGDYKIFEYLEIEINTYVLELGSFNVEYQVLNNLQILTEKYSTCDVYFIYARFLNKNRKTRNALTILSKGLDKFPTDEKCLSLKAHILSNERNKNLKDYYNTLLKWKSITLVQNLKLLYELGKTSFILGYYNKSREVFQELEQLSMGHRLRTRHMDIIRSDEGDLQRFEGIIHDLQSQYVGYLNCYSLRNLEYWLPFRPISCDFTPKKGDQVNFHIAFNYRYPIAINVRKG